MPEPNVFPRVAIAGFGATTAVGRGINSLLAALRENKSGLRPLEKFNSSRFQSKIVGAASKNETDNPAWQLAGEAIREARDSAKEILETIPPERLGFVLSTTKANIEALERIFENRPCSEMARRHLQPDLLAADLAKQFGAHGVVQCVSLACVSGLVAIQQGAKIIQRGAADAVFVVGVDCLSNFVMAGFSALKALDPIGCRPFDKNRCGLSPGEAGAAIVLVGQASNLSRSKWRFDTQEACPPVKILGWSGSNDANHLTGPSRDGSGLTQAISAALKMANVSANGIDYINAHGTGTIYNDAMESLALKNVFGEKCPPFSAAKGMFGHTLGAAGVVETILCALAIREKILPGTPRLNSPAEIVPAEIVLKPRPFKNLNCVLKLNTGFGGANGALVLGHE